MSVTYTAVLPAREHTVNVLTELLGTERARRGTRAGTRAVPARDQAILILRWFLDDTRMRQLATDNQISVSTGYDYLNEGWACPVLTDIRDQGTWGLREDVHHHGEHG
jgi:hypothetical protein